MTTSTCNAGFWSALIFGIQSLKFKRSPTLTTFQWNWGNQVCVLPACQKQAPSRNPLELRHLYTWPSKPCRSIVQHTVLLFRVGLRCKKASWKAIFLSFACVLVSQKRSSCVPSRRCLRLKWISAESFLQVQHISQLVRQQDVCCKIDHEFICTNSIDS